MRNVFRQTAFAVCLASIGPLARAQEQPAASNPWVQVARVVVHPGLAADFEDYAKKIMAARTKLAVSLPTFAYQTAMGGNPYTYHFVTPFNGWAEMDALPSVPATLLKAYGDLEGNKLLKSGRSAIQEVVTDVYRLRLDLSTHPKPGAPPSPWSTLTISEHRGDTLGGYLRILGKIKKAEEQDPSFPTVLRYVLTNGDGAVTVAARPSNTLAERETWPNQNEVLRKVYGEGEQNDMTEAIARSLVKRSTVILSLRADLSKLPSR